jgi:uncharacterized protein with NRDE domain
MCLILLAHDAHPEYRLVVATNRDELYARPTAPAAFWGDAPELLAGRDLRSGGTWMGITRGGRFSALTNVRELPFPAPDAPSRGHLVSDFLRGRESPEAYLAALSSRAEAYPGFNLLVGEGAELWHLSNRAPGARALSPGVYGVSNALLDTPWPKVERGKAALREALAGGGEVDPEALFRVLSESEPFPDALLPDTGVGVERERVLSSLFIASPDYGTRASTVLLLRRDGRARFVERTVTPGGGWTEAAYALETGRAPVAKRR